MQFELLKSFVQEGPLTVTVNGNCMQQTIPDGSRLRLESSNAYWPGDAVAFRRSDGEIVCHRFLGYVLTRNGWRAITRAENTRQMDAPVYLKDVLGKVTLLNGRHYRPGWIDRTAAVKFYFSGIIKKLKTYV